MRKSIFTLTCLATMTPLAAFAHTAPAHVHSGDGVLWLGAPIALGGLAVVALLLAWRARRPGSGSRSRGGRPSR